MYKFIFSCFFLVFVFSIDGNAQAKTDISFGLRIGKSELLLDYEPITINDENGDHWRTLTLDDALNRLSRYEVGFFLFFAKRIGHFKVIFNLVDNVWLTKIRLCQVRNDSSI